MVGLAVLGQAQLGGDQVGNLAEDADPLAFTDNVGSNAGMQVRHILGPLILEGQAEFLRQSFHGALDREEVFVIAVDREAQMRDLIGQLCHRQGLGEIYILQLEHTAFHIAELDIVDHSGQHGRSQGRTHDGQAVRNRIQDPNAVTFDCVRREMEGVQIGVRVEGQGLDLIEALGAHAVFDLLPALLLRCQAAAGHGRVLHEGGDDLVVAVFTDDFLGQIRIADLDVFPVAGRDDIQMIAVPGDLEGKSAQDIQNGIGRHVDAQDAVDAAQGTGEVQAVLFIRAFKRLAVLNIKMGSGDLTDLQFLDQVQGPCHAQFDRILGNAPLIMGGGVRALAQAPGCLSDVVTLELGAFQQQFPGILRDLRGQAAHDAAQALGL